MPRKRPIAGHRGRSRLGSPPEAEDQPRLDAAEPVTTSRTDVPPPASPPAMPVPSPPSGPARRGRLEPAIVVAGLVVLALAVAAGTFTLRARAAARTESARTAAQAAAESRVVDLLSYDYRHLGRDFARARRGLTGDFAQDYARTTQKVVRPTAREVKAVVKAEVASSAVVRGGENQVVALVFVNQTTTSTRVEGPRVDLNRVRLTLVRTGGDWLIAKVVAL